MTCAHDTVSDYADFILHDDTVQKFDTRWDKVLLSMSKIPSDDILESLYKLRIRESEKLKTELGTTWRFIRRYRFPTIKLKTTVKRRKDQKLRLRNFDARRRKGSIGVEGGKGIRYQWKDKGQCSKGDQCSFQHETKGGAQKTRTHCRHTF